MRTLCRPLTLLAILAGLVDGMHSQGRCQEFALQQANAFDATIDRTTPIVLADSTNYLPAGGPKYTPVCFGCGSSCYTGEGFFFSTEVGFIQAVQSNDNNLPRRLLQANTPPGADIGDLGSNYTPTARFVGGYQTCDGLGFRVRYWDYSDSQFNWLPQPVPGAPNQVTHALDTAVLDIEVMKSMSSGIWDTTLSGGYRLAVYDEAASVALNNAPQSSVKTRFVGNGMTGALGVARRFGGHFSLMATPRFSLLFGDPSVDPSTLSLALLNDNFDARWILETQIGATYERPFDEGAWFVRGGYEVQYWDDFVESIGAQTNPSWTLFHGFFVTAGLRR